MTIGEVYLEIVKLVKTIENISNTDLDDAILEGIIGESLTLLRNNTRNAFVINFVQQLAVRYGIDEADGVLKDEFDLKGDVYTIDFASANFQHIKRSFFYNGMDFKFLSINFCENINQKDVVYKYMLDFILEACVLRILNTQDCSDVLISFFRQNKDAGFLITRVPTLEIEKTYLFAYVKTLNSGQYITLNPNLKYSRTPLSNTLNFNDSFDYRQYLEIYDILYDLVSAQDVLTRFLKLYHLIEFLAYRMELKEIVARTSTKSFYREISALSQKVKDERVTVAKNFEILLDTYKTDIISVFNSLSTDQCNFIINELRIKIASMDPNRRSTKISDKFTIKEIAEFIYNVRCSIVHSKDTELHFTISNHEAYELILPLLKDLIPVLEEKLMEIITSKDIKIKYDRQEIKVYH